MNVEELCYADMLAHKEGWYIVRRIWQRPVWSDHREPRDRIVLTYTLEGFDLIESTTGTVRQVKAHELQLQLDEGVLTLYHPPTVRRVGELT